MMSSKNENFLHDGTFASSMKSETSQTCSSSSSSCSSPSSSTFSVSGATHDIQNVQNSFLETIGIAASRTTVMLSPPFHWLPTKYQRMFLGEGEKNNTIPPQKTIASLVVALTAFYLIYRRRAYSRKSQLRYQKIQQQQQQQQQTNNAAQIGHYHRGRTRSAVTLDTINTPPRHRSTTEDIPGILEEIDDTAVAFKEDIALVTSPSSSTAIHHKQHPIQGPSHQHLTYKTWTPPPPWNEVASKAIVLPSSNSMTKRKLERTLILELSESSLMVVESHHPYNGKKKHHHHQHDAPASSSASATKLGKKKTDIHDKYPIRWNLSDISLQVQEPVEGGVLQLYQKKNTNKAPLSTPGQGSTSSRGGRRKRGDDTNDDEGGDSVEFTFTSAHDAAQFQQDLVAYQILGEPILNMYRALELIQKGSSTTTTQEYVLHDNYNRSTDGENAGAGSGTITSSDSTDPKHSKPANRVFTSNIGVSWDDAMRCFSSLQPLRSALDSQLELTMRNDEALASRASRGGRSSKKTLEEREEKEQHLYCLDPIYIGKRRLLGYVDFFRLFVPSLPKTSKPQSESSPDRMEQLLRWRKRVARASVFVRSYVRAKQIANQGWHLSPPMPMSGQRSAAADGKTDTDDTILKKRSAFDDDHDNIAHDAQQKNEYYEATVSRDVRCDVHSPLHMSQQKGASTPSPYQAYTLVGCHSFQISQSSAKGLAYNRDPVQCLPSLLKIIERHPDQHFLIVGFFPEGLKIGVILLFVRSLPKGVDPAFDLVLDRYVNGTKEQRDRKFEVFMQLGPGSGLSPLAWGALKAMSAFLKWTRRGEVDVPYEASGGGQARTPFPGMTMNNYTETTHFGGSLLNSNKNDNNSPLPKNYVAATAHVDVNNMSNMAARLLYQRLEDDALPSSIVDFSFVLEGEQDDELPERTIATIRMVHMDVVKTAVALPEDDQRVVDTPSVGPTKTPSGSAQGDREVPSLLLPSFSADSAADERIPSSTPPERPSSWFSSFISTSAFFSTRESTINNGDSKQDEEEVAEISEFDKIGISEIEERYRSGVLALGEVLDGVSVPYRKDGLTSTELQSCSAANTGVGGMMMTQQMPTFPSSVKTEDLINCSILKHLNKYDIRRFYVASKCDLKSAAVRIVESAAWRGITFPIDTRECRIELQSGQFFQQGHDKMGNPIFYFQSMLLGPWRKDTQAVVTAVLHRTNVAFRELSASNPDFKCTVIILMGKPFHAIKKKKQKKQPKKKSSDRTNTEEESASPDDLENDEFQDNQQSKKASSSSSTPALSWNPFNLGVNPRLDSGEEEYYMHSNMALATKMIDILSAHYPERLANALLVPGKGGSGYLLTALGGTLGLRAYIPDKRTRAKVHILGNPTELLEYVDSSQLATFVGGDAPITSQAFEF